MSTSLTSSFILGVFFLIQHCPAAFESVCRFRVHSFILLLLCLYSGHKSTPCFMRASVGSTAPSKHSVSVLIDPTNRTAFEHGEPANIGWHVELIPIRLLFFSRPRGHLSLPVLLAKDQEGRRGSRYINMLWRSSYGLPDGDINTPLYRLNLHVCHILEVYFYDK